MTAANRDAIDALVARWLAALEARHLASLRFQEVSRALAALSSAYVERRGALGRGAALDGDGKRAAFALFYGPIHLLTVGHVVAALPPPGAPIDTIVDLGCGTGTSGAAWALALGGRPRVAGVDRHHWAVEEARWTYHALGLRGRAVQGDVVRGPRPPRRAGMLASYVVNEITDEGRAVLLEKMLAAHDRGATVLIVEPVSRRVAPWWETWAGVFVREGGRADEWRFDAALPEIVRRLDRAAGLSHDVLTARSLWLPA